ncbi:MAG: TetR/AcrR family transcriptional regulator [Candidatus Pacebacteria bacterium]|nr:TetR/AcrR family transcriptional regulator [Candidatus Paceibacterota bacterium]
MGTITKQPEYAIRDTKKYILDVARQLFSEYSYLGVSMNDIAKKLKITKAALYYHFTGKAEVYGKVLDAVSDDLSLSIAKALKETTTDKKLRRIVTNYLDFGFEEKNLIKALILKLSPNNPQITKHITRLRERVANLIHPVIKEVFANKKIIQKVDSRLLTFLLISMMDGLLLEYSFLNKKINSAKVSDQMIAVLF